MSLTGLLSDIKKLKKDKALKKKISDRLREFRENGKKKSSEIFNELCFCILTANFRAEKSIEIQEKMGNGFSTLAEKKLAKKLKGLGHRHPNTRANYIALARKHQESLKGIISSCSDEKELREWLVENIKGLGYKEASHFLRNIGFVDVAIIDFHIIDLLARYGLVKKPSALTKKKYLEIEELLKKIGKKSGLNMAELDLYLWYIETGKVLK